MTDNIYAAPTVPLTGDESIGKSGEFYIVSKRKFFTLCILTLGLYPIYWSYKNWRLHQIASGDNMIPVMRGLFLIFFMHRLCELIDRRLEAAGKSFDWKPRSHASTVVALVILSNLLDRLTGKSIGSPITDILSLLILFPLSLAFYKIQTAINLACNDPTGSSNDKFTPLNYLWIVIGALLWAGSIYFLIR